MARKKQEIEGSADQAGPTLAAVCDGYLKALETQGAGYGTLMSYGMELTLAKRGLGGERAVAAISTVEVHAYFISEAVLNTRGGKPKASTTIAKTRRVLRLALLWARDEGLIDAVPLPKASVAIVGGA